MIETIIAWNDWRRRVTERAYKKPHEFFTLVVYNGDWFPHLRTLYTDDRSEAENWAKEIWRIGLPEAATVASIELHQDTLLWHVPNPTAPPQNEKSAAPLFKKP